NFGVCALSVSLTMQASSRSLVTAMLVLAGRGSSLGGAFFAFLVIEISGLRATFTSWPQATVETSKPNITKRDMKPPRRVPTHMVGGQFNFLQHRAIARECAQIAAVRQPGRSLSPSA